MVVGITTVVGAMAVPMMSNTMKDLRLGGDARGLSGAVAVAKLRAAASFSQARLFVDLGAQSYHIETWQKTGAPSWVTEGGSTSLSTGVTFGFGAIAAPPLNTQVVIGQAAPCVTTTGNPIANTACVLFNSRGIPVAPAGAPPNVGAPTGEDALYVTDGMAVYGLTISATGLSKTFRTNTSATNWVQQ